MSTSTDNFAGVLAALDPPANGSKYVAGEKLTIRITGDDVVTSVEHLVVNLTISNPKTGGVSAPIPVAADIVATDDESVVIKAASDGTARAWAVDAGGLSVSATA